MGILSNAEVTTRDSALASAGGFLAILLWSATIAVARSISEQVGPLTAGAAVCCVSGALAVVRLALSGQRRRRIRRLPLKYVLGCGALFVAYMLALYLAVGLADGRQQVLEVGLLNYLWPATTILFTVLLLKKKAGLLLLPATLMALCGVFLVLTQGEDVSWHSFTRNVATKPAVYALALYAGVSWGLYSALTRRWAGRQAQGAVDIFLPATAVVLVVLCLLLEDGPEWTVRAAGETAFLGLATYVAYGLWDGAMRRGNVVMVAAGSYLTPLLSTLVTSLYLSVAAERSLWIGCAVLVAGSLLSWLSVSDERHAPEMP